MRIAINTILTSNSIEGTEHCSVPILSNSVVVVIDVLRASTTICSALYNGAKEVIPCSSIDDAKDIFSRYSKDTTILGGERNGIKPLGFDSGNSPFEYSRKKVENKTVILTTTNGTQALQKVKNSKMILIGCFVNLSSIDAALNKIALVDNFESEITFVCAGNNGKSSLEDTLCAGVLINKLVNRYDNCYLNDNSKLAMKTFIEMKDNLLKECYNSEHGKKLIKLGFKEDIDLALKYDIYPIVPVFKDGIITTP